MLSVALVILLVHMAGGNSGLAIPVSPPPPPPLPPIGSAILHNSPPPPPPASPSGFDTIMSLSYTAASAPPAGLPARKPFTSSTLKSWRKTHGGLKDSDRLLLGEIAYSANSIFEFGLGESTRIIAYTNMPVYKGMDSDPGYVTTVRDSSPKHFRFFFADLGKTISWGRAEDPSLAKIAYSYQVEPLVPEKTRFDVYVVDGRYRAACVYSSFLHSLSASPSGPNQPPSLVMLHDFTEENSSNEDRSSYLSVKGVADVVERSQKYQVLKLKSSTTEEMLIKMWRKYSTDFV
jgi:hypothetical protein